MKTLLHPPKFLNLLFLFTLALFCTNAAVAQATFNGSVTGNWSAPGTWTLTGGNDIDNVPDADDTVTLVANITVTVDSGSQACASFTAGPAGNSTATLKFNSGTTLTVGGLVTLGISGSPAHKGSLDMSNGGTLACQGFVLTNLNTFTTGTGTIVMTATNTMPAGFPTFNNLTIATGTTKLSANTTIGGKLDLNTGTLDLNSFTASVGELSSSGNLTNVGTAKILTVGSANTNSTYSGVLSATTPANLALTKTGTGTLTLLGNNTYTGATVISSGTLELGAADRIANTSAITVSGGTLSTGAATGFSETIGTVTLSANSAISLGSGVHTLTIANSSGVTWGAFTLTINNWSGNAGVAGGSTAGKIQVGAGGLGATQLAKVQFTGYPLGAAITASGELVPSKSVYYSKGSLAPEAAASWNTKRDGTGTNAAAGDFTVGTSFIIQNGHTMTTGGAWGVSGTGSKIQIESGGTLISTSAITVNAATTFQIDNGGTYKHQNTGAWASTIFTGTESFGNTSTIEINSTNASLPTNSSYGNLVINLTVDPAATMSFAGNLTTVNGDLIIQNTQGREIRLGANTSPVVTIGGDFSLSGATSLFVFTSGTGSPNVTVNGDTTISGGTLNLNVTGASGSGTLNCKGNFTHTGATITKTGSGVANSIIINGTTAQTIESTGFTAVNFTVAPTGAGTVEIPAAKTFVDGSTTVFTVSNSSTATELTVNGTLNRTSSANVVPTGSIAFGPSSKYISNFSGGTLPTASWNASSVLQIDATIADNEFTESFGDVNINGASAFTMGSSATSPVIQGNLTLSGSALVGFSNSTNLAATLTVNGNLTLNGSGSFVIDNAVSNANIAKRVIVSGDYSQSSGTLNLSNNTNASITAGTRNTQIDVSGNFSHTGGTISETATDADMITRINLIGTGSKAFESTGQTGQVEIVLNKTGTATNDIVTLPTSSNIDYKLTLTDGLIVLNSSNLTLGATATITAPGTSASMIVPQGSGQLRKVFTATGTSFLYPVGDNTGLEYSPITINLTAGSGFASPYIGVSLTDGKHPDNFSTTNYLTRYWSVGQSGITGAQITATGTYTNTISDVAGNVTDIKAAVLNGAFNVATNPWNKTGGSVLSGSTLTYAAAPITSGQLSAFTGITAVGPSVNITGGGNICHNAGATLTATASGGDGTLTYLWTGLITGSTTSPTATVDTSTIGGPNAYSVTVTDVNGIVAIANTSVTILGTTTYYADTDEDGFGDVNAPIAACEGVPAGYVTNNTDCNDDDGAIYRNGSFYADADGDGYTTGGLLTVCYGLATPAGYAVNSLGTDCAPGDPTKWRTGNFYIDGDNDGFYDGNDVITTNVCYGATTPSGYVTEILGTDCNDSNPEINPNHVEVLANSVDDNCDGVSDEVARTSYLQPAQCGITLSHVSNTLYAFQLFEAEGYRFEVTGPVGPPRSFDSATNAFTLTSLPGGITYNTTYAIRVALKLNGFWRAYGTSCNITTPAVPATTNLVPTQCGATLTSLFNTLYANQVPAASQYRFEVTGGVQGVRTFDTSLNRFSLLNLTAGAAYHTTYSVRVALFIGGVWQAYGTACDVTTPLAPLPTNLQPSQCGSTISNSWTTIYAIPVSEATGYRFEVFNGAITQYIDTSVPRFNIHQIPAGYAANTAYTIRVAILFESVYQAFGTSCTFNTSAGLTKLAAVDSVFIVKASPNPFTNTFRLDAETSSQEQVAVKVYDMIGKLVETRQVNAAQLAQVEIGENYPSGVYNVIVTQGTQLKTLRIIKR
jgi:autotransporter-associated beta strand protein